MNAIITAFTSGTYINPAETGFYYVSSRYYDPEIVRFISADTVDLVLASQMTLTDKNLYAYCDNNPIVRVDSTGAVWEAFYVEYDFFIGEYDDVKMYPTVYDSDIHRRILVMSKDTVDGEHFMDALIEYERYNIEEIKPYFEETFKKYIMPPILEGKKIILENQQHYFAALFPEERCKVLEKLQR